MKRFFQLVLVMTIISCSAQDSFSGKWLSSPRKNGVQDTIIIKKDKTDDYILEVRTRINNELKSKMFKGTEVKKNVLLLNSGKVIELIDDEHIKMGKLVATRMD